MYIGQQPATTFDAGIQDRFTGLSTNTVTLTHEIAAEEDILVVWNNIVQDKNTYSCGGTGNKTITLGGTLSSSDVVTVYYLNKVMQSVNPTAGSVNTTQLADLGVTGAKLNTDVISAQTALGATPADTDELLVSDAGVLKRVDYSYLKGGDNTPSFAVLKDGDQSVSDNTWTKVELNDEKWDTDTAFDSSTNYRFTVPSGKGGKYHMSGYIGFQSNGTDEVAYMAGQLRKNGSEVKDIAQSMIYNSTVGFARSAQLSFSATTNLAAGDYIELWGRIDDTNNSGMAISQSYLSGHKLIGV